jgi:hypothetical protein
LEGIMAVGESVSVAVRHVISDKVTGGLIAPKQRTITYDEAQGLLRRPATGESRAHVRCPTCSAELVLGVRCLADTRRVRRVCGTLAAICVPLFIACLATAIHLGGQVLPEGQSLSPLMPISVIGVFVTFVASFPLLITSRSYGGVILREAPRPRSQHRLAAGRYVLPAVAPEAVASQE